MFTYFFRSDFSVAISRLMLISFVALLPFMGGCGEDDNPIVDDHDHEEEEIYHADADGFALEVGGTEVYRQLQGEHSGALTVGVDEEIEVHVTFLDATGAEVHIGEEEEDEHDEHDHDEEETFALSLTGYDEVIIDIHLSEDEHDEDEHDEDEHDEDEHDEELGFGLEGLKAGTTEIKLQLLHGDHPDFTGALLIPVTVQ